MSEAISNTHPNKLGPYRLVRKIGEGGMGLIYEAFHEDLRQSCALKICKVDSLNEETLKRWRREIVSMAALSHPNVVAVLNSGEDGAYHFLAMELISGHDLDAVLNYLGRLTLEETLWVLDGVLSGLVHIHSHELIHRDIKPANVMVTSVPCVKIMDFGLVRVTNATGITKTDSFLGTPRYIAPEMLLGEGVNHLCDSYLAGELIFELLTGSPLFRDKGLAPMLMDKLNRTIVATDLPAALAPPQLQGLFCELLSTEAEQRPSAKETLERIRRLSRTQTIGPGRLVGDLESKNPLRKQHTPGSPASDRTVKRPIISRTSSIRPTGQSVNKRYGMTALVAIVFACLAWYALSRKVTLAPIEVLLHREPVRVHWCTTEKGQVHCEVRSPNTPSKHFDCLPAADGLVEFDLPRLRFATPYTIELSQNGTVCRHSIELPAVDLRGPPTVSHGPGWIRLKIELEDPAPIKVKLSKESTDFQWSDEKTFPCSDTHIYFCTADVATVQRHMTLQLSIKSRSHQILQHEISIVPLRLKLNDKKTELMKSVLMGNAPIIGNEIYLLDVCGNIGHIVAKHDESRARLLATPHDTPCVTKGTLVALDGELGLVTTGDESSVVTFRTSEGGLVPGRILPTPLEIPLPPNAPKPAVLHRGCAAHAGKVYLPLEIGDNTTIIQCIDCKTKEIRNSIALDGKPCWTPYVTDDLVCVATRRGAETTHLFCFDPVTLTLKWKLPLKGLCNRQVRESDGWLLVCDDKAVYRLHPDRQPSEGLQVELGEASLEISGVDSPPIRIGDRGWLVLTLPQNIGVGKMGAPAVTSFAWDSFSDLRAPVKLPCNYPQPFLFSNTIAIAAHNDILYAAHELEIYAIETKDLTKITSLPLPYDLRSYAYHPDGYIVVICYNTAFLYRLWPEEAGS